MITEDGKVEFNEQEQAVIDKAMGERLGREGIQDMKEIMEDLKKFGYTGTPAEIKAAIKADANDFVNQLKDSEKQQTLEQLQQQAKDTGTTPELLATINALKEDMSEIKNKSKAAEDAVNQQITAQKTHDDQIDYFATCEETKDVDLKKLNENPKFIKFLSKQRPTGKKDFLVEAYKDFAEIVGGAEAAAIAKINANLDRTTASGKTKGDSSGGTYGLTSAQIELVDDWNRKNPKNQMTYKKYAEKL